MRSFVTRMRVWRWSMRCSSRAADSCWRDRVLEVLRRLPVRPRSSITGRILRTPNGLVASPERQHAGSLSIRRRFAFDQGGLARVADDSIEQRLKLAIRLVDGQTARDVRKRLLLVPLGIGAARGSAVPQKVRIDDGRFRGDCWLPNAARRLVGAARFPVSPVRCPVSAARHPVSAARCPAGDTSRFVRFDGRRLPHRRRCRSVDQLSFDIDRRLGFPSWHDEQPDCRYGSRPAPRAPPLPPRPATARRPARRPSRAPSATPPGAARSPASARHDPDRARALPADWRARRCVTVPVRRWR